MKGLARCNPRYVVVRSTDAIGTTPVARLRPLLYTARGNAASSGAGFPPTRDLGLATNLRREMARGSKCVWIRNIRGRIVE